MRDKIYAHTDVDGLKTTDDDCLNKVGVVIQGGSARFAMTMVFPRDVQKIRSLTEALADTTWCRAEEIWKTYFKDDFVEDGNYEVNISKTDDTFLKVSSW